MARRNTDEKLDYTDFDVGTLPKKLLTLYNNMRTDEAAAKTSREAFINAFTQEARDRDIIPSGKRLVISTRWNKLSVALSDLPTDRDDPFEKSRKMWGF